jgi:hypothetical protein
MEFFFNLKDHCVETEGKQMYERMIRCYLSKSCTEEEKSAIESQMDLLKYFLENADFRKIRSAYPSLAGNGDVAGVILDLCEEKKDMTMIVNRERFIVKKENVWKKF